MDYEASRKNFIRKWHGAEIKNDTDFKKFKTAFYRQVEYSCSQIEGCSMQMESEKDGYIYCLLKRDDKCIHIRFYVGDKINLKEGRPIKLATFRDTSENGRNNFAISTTLEPQDLENTFNNRYIWD